jgi:hypothetical protein
MLAVISVVVFFLFYSIFGCHFSLTNPLLPPPSSLLTEFEGLWSVLKSNSRWQQQQHASSVCRRLCCRVLSRRRPIIHRAH